MALSSLLPAQLSIFQRLDSQYHNAKLPHAFLFDGPKGIGKLEFTLNLAKYFLCESDEKRSVGHACGECTACNLLRAGTHSDLRLIQPIESKQIKIEQIRDLIVWVNKTAQRNGLKIAILEPADQMNQRSANALLKCLEEPTPNTLIVLVTSQIGRLLPTIRSRCHRDKFIIPPRSEAIQWLQDHYPTLEDVDLKLDIAGGNPGIAKAIDEEYLKNRLIILKALTLVIAEKANPLTAVGLFKKAPLETTLLGFISLFADCVKLKMAEEPLSLKNSDLKPELLKLCEQCSGPFLISAYERVCRDLKSHRGPSNPNEALLLEGLMIDLGRQQQQILS